MNTQKKEKRFYNVATKKWVERLRPTSKGQRLGKAKGLTKGRAEKRKWINNGSPEKTILIPIKTNIELLKRESVPRSINFEYCLFILHKLLYNRIKSRKQNQNNRDYANNYTTLLIRA